MPVVLKLNPAKTVNHAPAVSTDYISQATNSLLALQPADFKNRRTLGRVKSRSSQAGVRDSEAGQRSFLSSNVFKA